MTFRRSYPKITADFVLREITWEITGEITVVTAIFLEASFARLQICCVHTESESIESEPVIVEAKVSFDGRMSVESANPNTGRARCLWADARPQL